MDDPQSGWEMKSNRSNRKAGASVVPIRTIKCWFELPVRFAPVIRLRIRRQCVPYRLSDNP